MHYLRQYQPCFKDFDRKYLDRFQIFTDAFGAGLEARVDERWVYVRDWDAQKNTTRTRNRLSKVSEST